MKSSDGSLDKTAAPASDPSLDRTAAATSSNPSLDDTYASDPGLAATTDSGSGTKRSSGPISPELDLEVGSRVGRYVVASKLGAGGMGVVLAAYDPELDRKVAIKLVRPDGGSDPSGLRARMVREAQAMARLAHPNVLAVFDVGTVGASVFVAMELVEGTTLGTWLETPRSRREILRVFDQAGRGLAAAHAAGLVHRDFKPDNVMIGKDGRVRVMDFGLARQTARVETSPPDPHVRRAKRPSVLSIELTHAGALLGTPVYMAPEQWTGQPADARSDQYAFCVALWEALYGVRPYSATTLDELQIKVTGQPPDPPPHDIKLSRRLGGALRRGLEKDPAARFSTIEALLDELAAEPLARRRLAFAGAALGLVGAGVIVSSFALRGSTTADRPQDAACDDPQLQLAGAWDDVRRGAVHKAVLATKLPTAAQTWTLLEQQLDARATEYVRVFAPTCRGEYRVPEHLRAAQTACLGRAKSQLGAFTEILTDLEPAELDHVVQATWSLDHATACEDSKVLTARSPPPADPKLAAQVEELRDQLMKAQANRIAGRGKPALAIAEDVLVRAQKLDHPGVLGQARAMVGGLVAAMGDAKRGEALLRDAYTTLLGAGDDYGAASAAVRLAKLAGYDKQRPEAARQWLEQANALVKRVGSPADLELERLSASGMIRYAVGDMEGARPLFEKAVEVGNKSLPPDDPRRSDQLNNLAGVLLATGDLEGAAKMSRESIELTRRTLGADHPDVAMGLMNLGLILGDIGKLDEAEADERAALALREKVLGSEHPDIVITLFNLGAILFKQKKLPEARDVAVRALTLSRKLHGDDHPDTADAIENLADVTEHLGDKAKARALYDQVLATRTKILEPGHPDIKRAADNVARMAAKKRAR